jgi:putative transposase
MSPTTSAPYSPEIHRHPLQRLYGRNDLHFITFSCYHRLPLLNSPSNRDCFVETLNSTRNKYHFLLLGYVVMPEHVHLIISEPKRADPSTALQVLKQKVSTQLSSTHTHPSFWQRRFYDFNVRSSEKLDEKLTYIHNNPTHRQLVSNLRDWPWSSWSAYTYNQGQIPIDIPHSSQ